MTARPRWKGDPVRDRTRRYSPSTVLRSVFLLLCLVGSVTACSSRDRADWPRPTHVRVLYCCDHRVYGPYWDMPAKLLVFQSLAGLDERGELEPRLARSWEHTDDYLHWTIHLRSDVRWHDGTPFTARDVAFTYELLAHPDVLWLPRGIVSATVLDDTTLTVDLAEGRAFDPLGPWDVVYPKHLLEGLDPSEISAWDFWAMPVGTGAYRYSRHVPNTMSEFIAYEGYWRGEPAIDTVTVRYAESAVTELLAGNVDILGWARIEDIPAVADDHRYAVYYDIDPTTIHGVLWNHRVPALADPRVRRAFTLAIDRPSLHRVLGLPLETPFFDVLASRRQYRSGAAPPPVAYDPAAAGRLLDEAGWALRDGRTIRTRDGVPLGFDLLVSQEGSKAAVFVQQELAEIGVDAEVQQLDLNLVRRRIVAGDFDVVVRLFPAGIGGRFGARSLFGTESVTGYRNPVVAALLLAAWQTADPDSLEALYRALWPEFQRDVPFTYLAPGVQAFVAHRRIRGLVQGTRAAPLMNMEYLSVAADQ
jgi:ABC-type transport system substrate-binding protein